MFESYKTYSLTPFSIILVSLNTAAKWVRMLTATWANWVFRVAIFISLETKLMCAVFHWDNNIFFSRGFAHWVGKDKKSLNDNRCHDQHCHDTDALPLNAFFFFLLSEICDRRGLTKTFLKMATLSVLIWAYPHEMKTSNENFKNAAICLHSVTTEIL